MYGLNFAFDAIIQVFLKSIQSHHISLYSVIMYAMVAQFSISEFRHKAIQIQHAMNIKKPKELSLHGRWP